MSLTSNLWPQNECRSQGPIFHGPVILPFILKTIGWMNTKLLDYVSLSPNLWPQNECWSSDLFFSVQWFGLVSCRLFDGWTSNFLGSESVGCNLWPQNESRSQWPIFHGPVILLLLFAFKNILVLLARHDSGELCCPATALIWLEFFSKVEKMRVFSIGKGAIKSPWDSLKICQN